MHVCVVHFVELCNEITSNCYIQQLVLIQMFIAFCCDCCLGFQCQCCCGAFSTYLLHCAV